MEPNLPFNPLDIQGLKAACGDCSLQELCLPVGLNEDEIEHLDQAIQIRRRVRRGDSLFRASDPFVSLFAVRRGFFKTFVVGEEGREQVTGFHMNGELLGLDAISSESHQCDAIALEDSEVCDVPYDRLEKLISQIPSLGHHFHKTMSREIVRDQGVMLLLGGMRAEARIAAFLLNLGQRYGARGYSRTEFVLRMTREEIGSYLGVQLETVSRTLSRLQAEGQIEVRGKIIRVIDLERLNKVVACR